MPTPTYSDFTRYGQEATAAARAAGLTGFWNGEADAFRHAYASAEMTREYGEGWARVLGGINELRHPLDIFGDEANMDLWNNARGREIGLNSTSKQDSVQQVLDALQNGTLIPNLADPRNRYYDDYATLPQVSLPSIYGIEGWDSVEINSATNNAYSAAQRFIPRRDPLTLDLNGNGLETLPINAANPVYFDLTGEGVQSSVGWVAPSDGFLALDRNGDGLINDGTELFGDATPAYEAGTTTPTTGKTADGFAALAQEDTNADGIVNSGDANFANLRVWQDLNQDGVSQDGELKTLAELGIESFNVASINHSQLLANGNQIADTGTFTRMDGTSGTAGVTAGMADINLAVDTFHRTFADAIPLTDTALPLPDMQGSGAVRDLSEAASIQASEGATLATALGQFAASTTRNEQRAQLDTLITDWAATSGFEDMATQAAAHGYTLTSNLGPEWQHKLHVLETFNGRSFYSMPWDNTNAQSGVTGMSVSGNHITISMNGTQLALLDRAYTALKESVYDALVVQRMEAANDAVFEVMRVG